MVTDDTDAADNLAAGADDGNDVHGSGRGVGEYTWHEFLREHGHETAAERLYADGSSGELLGGVFGATTTDATTPPDSGDWERVEVTPATYLGFAPAALPERIETAATVAATLDDSITDDGPAVTAPSAPTIVADGGSEEGDEDDSIDAGAFATDDDADEAAADDLSAEDAAAEAIESIGDVSFDPADDDTKLSAAADDETDDSPGLIGRLLGRGGSDETDDETDDTGADVDDDTDEADPIAADTDDADEGLTIDDESDADLTGASVDAADEDTVADDTDDESGATFDEETADEDAGVTDDEAAAVAADEDATEDGDDAVTDEGDEPDDAFDDTTAVDADTADAVEDSADEDEETTEAEESVADDGPFTEADDAPVDAAEDDTDVADSEEDAADTESDDITAAAEDDEPTSAAEAADDDADAADDDSATEDESTGLVGRLLGRGGADDTDESEDVTEESDDDSESDDELVEADDTDDAIAAAADEDDEADEADEAVADDDTAEAIDHDGTDDAVADEADEAVADADAESAAEESDDTEPAVADTEAAEAEPADETTADETAAEATALDDERTEEETVAEEPTTETATAADAADDGTEDTESVTDEVATDAAASDDAAEAGETSVDESDTAADVAADADEETTASAEAEDDDSLFSESDETEPAAAADAAAAADEGGLFDDVTGDTDETTDDATEEPDEAFDTDESDDVVADTDEPEAEALDSDDVSEQLETATETAAAVERAVSEPTAPATAESGGDSLPTAIDADLESKLAKATDAADTVSELVDTRTVDVNEELDEDRFFSTADGHTTLVNRYDLEKSVPMRKKRHFREVERYWVNKPYAFVVIFHSRKENEKKYYVVEAHLNEIERDLKEFLSRKLRMAIKYSDEDMVMEGDDADRRQVIERETERLMRRYDLRDLESQGRVDRFLRRMGVRGEDGPTGPPTGIEARPEPAVLNDDPETLNEYQVEKLLYMLQRDFIGYGKIDGIKHDINVEDISCDGYNSRVFVYHTSYESIISNISHGKQTLDDFVVKLAQRSGKGISKRQPQVDATLPDGSRAQLTLGNEVSDHGTNYTIRQFKDVPFTPVDLINWNTFSLEEMAFLWMCIENNKSMLFAGGTASGKTTALNACSLFIPSKAKIVSIEDTREVKLPQRNWVASVTRPSFAQDDSGDIDEFDLLEAALRQRPEYIVFGEVRGEEGRTLFQVMSTGHTTYTTFHADSVAEVLRRFTTDPINVSKTMFTALDLVAIQTQTRVQGKKVRRNRNLTEINHYDAENDEINVQDLYQWQAETDDYLKMGASNTLQELRFDRGWSQQEIDDEMFRRKLVLSYLIKNGLNDYAQVAATLQAYINDPETTMALIAQDRLEAGLDDLREMESVDIGIEQSKEEMFPRPEPSDDLLSQIDGILEEAEGRMLEEYRGRTTQSIEQALEDISGGSDASASLDDGEAEAVMEDGGNITED
jgi:flagellar protein FlaI